MPVYNYITSSGLIVPDSTFIGAQVVTEYQDLFGADLVTTPSTPQGMLIVAEQLARVAVADNNALLANQINPNVAGGIFLDAIMALTNPFGRLPATPSIVLATVSGTAGTVIPANSIVADSTYNNQFQNLEPITISGIGFTANVPFYSIVYGPIVALATQLTVIVTPVLGWVGVTNPDAAVVGETAQSDQQARLYRLETLATQGSSTAQAITSALADIPGAESASFLENTAATTQTIDGVSMVSHSIYTCVYNTNPLAVGTFSFVLATLTGTPAAVIPAGTKVSSNGFVFQMVASATIGGGGTVTGVSFVAVSTGAIPVPINTLTVIVVPVTGLSSVTNPAVGTPGLQSPIAYALVSKKSAGAAYNNGSGVNVSSVIVVPYSNQLATVLFDTPNQISINIIVNVKLLGSVENVTQTVQNSILAYAMGNIPGVAGLTVGQAVSSFELAGAVTQQNPNVYVQSLYIAYSPTTPTSSDELAINIYEVATINVANIIVNVIPS